MTPNNLIQLSFKLVWMFVIVLIWLFRNIYYIFLLFIWNMKYFSLINKTMQKLFHFHEYVGSWIAVKSHEWYFSFGLCIHATDCLWLLLYKLFFSSDDSAKCKILFYMGNMCRQGNEWMHFISLMCAIILSSVEIGDDGNDDDEWRKAYSQDFRDLFQPYPSAGYLSGMDVKFKTIPIDIFSIISN